MAPSRPAAQSPRRRAPRRPAARAATPVARGALGLSRLPRVPDRPPGAVGRRPRIRPDRAAVRQARAGRLAGAGGRLALAEFRAGGRSRPTDPAPVDYAAAALAAGDEEGRERLRAALETWPAGLRRRVHARFRALAAEKAGARARGTEPKGFARRPVSRAGASLINSAPTCLRNSELGISRTPLRTGGQGAESHQFRPSDRRRSERTQEYQGVPRRSRGRAAAAVQRSQVGGPAIQGRTGVGASGFLRFGFMEFQ